MSYQSFAEIIEQVERDFGESIELSPPADDPGIPEALKPLYAFSNGFELPFAFINKATDCKRDTDPGWVNFGFDFYFSFFLCHESDRPAFTTWDHDSGTEIEGVWETPIEWLVALYDDYIAQDTKENEVHLTDIPESVSKTEAIAELKRISPKSTTELLALLRSGSLVVGDVVRSDAFRAVRALQDLGVSCHVVCDS